MNTASPTAASALGSSATLTLPDVIGGLRPEGHGRDRDNRQQAARADPVACTPSASPVEVGPTQATLTAPHDRRTEE